MKLEDDLFKALGHFALNAAALDYGIQWLVWLLLGTDFAVGATVTAQQSFAWRVSKLGTLARTRIRDQRLLNEVDRVIQKSKAAMDRRHEVLHGVWPMETEDDQGLTLTNIRLTKTGPVVSSKFLTVSQLEDVAQELADCFSLAQALEPQVRALNLPG